jgi:Ca2+-transporting ATPase
MRDGELRPLGHSEHAKAHDELEKMAAGALRVLAFACRTVDGKDRLTAEDENGLVFLGLMGMIDPPRPEARDALIEARSAGIETVMITGDNLLTAKAIAQDLGLLKPGDEAVTGKELEAMSDEDLAGRIDRLRVFARVWPEQKLRIVQALQHRHEVVAMTGDGVNDAPALKKADIGVAMGITGTDVAKETADVVLTDDNFATIVHAIEQGRVIFDNIRKFVVYLLACNVGEIFVIFIPILLGLHSPLWPVQILLVNLVTDGLPALALGVDAPEPGVMRRRPRSSREGIISSYSLLVVVYTAVFITLGAIGSYLAGIVMQGMADLGAGAMVTWDQVIHMIADGKVDHQAGMTMAFVTLSIAELFRAYSSRSERENFWQINPFTNKQLLWAVAASAAVVTATVLWAPLRELFKNVPLTGAEWAVALGMSLVPFLAYEAWKFVRRTSFRVEA